MQFSPCVSVRIMGRGSSREVGRIDLVGDGGLVDGWTGGRVEEMMEEGGAIFGKTSERVAESIESTIFSTPSLAILIHRALDFESDILRKYPHSKLPVASLIDS